ncbi:MAG: hypothetical protein NDP13_02435 [Crenarchaeota archaeon]|nr:hypothetical protein [Thermoproteota archaeon]MCR8453829.1 hypothetical protein [Thermoproteota archaeon]MCR8455352.1 hypothetical protein [Thermoproteota archaeon]MCR8462622.1 hypothetical protein [Thermoproteota archaeon]MCR8470931.1 hypothetical protein [Thermoproteota archaeon]
MNSLPDVASIAVILATASIFSIDCKILWSNLGKLKFYIDRHVISQYRIDIDIILALISTKTRSVKFAIESLDEFNVPESLKSELITLINDTIFLKYKGKNPEKKFPLLYSILTSGAIHPLGNMREDAYFALKKESIEKQLASLSEFEDTMSFYLFLLFLLPMIIYQLVFLTGALTLFIAVAFFHLIISVYQRRKISMSNRNSS